MADLGATVHSIRNHIPNVRAQSKLNNKKAGLILGLRPANEGRRYFVTTSLIAWAQT